MGLIVAGPADVESATGAGDAGVAAARLTQGARDRVVLLSTTESIYGGSTSASRN